MTKRDNKALSEMLLLFLLIINSCRATSVLAACSVISVLPSPAMKCFELLPLLVVVVEFGLFGAVNGNFRAERPNIDEQPNLVNLTVCNGQITYNGSTIPSNLFTVDNSNAGVYRCVNTGESVTVIRKSSILLLLLLDLL